MTILEVTAVPFTPSHRGGGESYPWRLARALSRYEDVISCFAADAPVPPGGTPYRTIPAWFFDAPPFFSSHNPLPTPASARAMTEVILDAAREVEFVHVHNVRTAMSTAWLLLGRRLQASRRFRIVLTDHNAHWFPFPRLTARCADLYAPVSPESEAQLASYARRPSRVIPPGVPSDYAPLGAPNLPWELRTTDLVFFGRIARWKRPDLVLRMAHDLREPGGPPLRVLIAGSNVDPEYTRWLREEARRLELGDSVKFVLDPTDEEAVALLRASKVHLLLSSGTDAFGRSHGSPELAPATVIEAAACGAPSVCSEVPGVRQQVVHGRTGFVGPLTRWSELVGYTRGLVREPEAWNPMSQAARAFVANERTYDVLARRLSQFLQLSREGRL